MASALEDVNIRSPSDVEVDLRRKFTIAEYWKMAELGILSDERTELLYGEIFRMMPIGPPHSECVTELNRFFIEKLPKEKWRVVSQATLEVDEHMPEPDLYIARGSRRAMSGRFPTSEELALVLEVSDSSLRRDRGIKLSVYAESMIQTYWIVNLLDRQIEVYTDPYRESAREKSGYRSTRIYREHEPLTMMFENIEVKLSPTEILPLKCDELEKDSSNSDATNH